MLLLLDEKLSLDVGEEKELQDVEEDGIIDEELEQLKLLLSLLEETLLDEHEVEETEDESDEELEDVECLEELELEEQHCGQLSERLLLDEMKITETLDDEEDCEEKWMLCELGLLLLVEDC